MTPAEYVMWMKGAAAGIETQPTPKQWATIVAELHLVSYPKLGDAGKQRMPTPKRKSLAQPEQLVLPSAGINLEQAEVKGHG